MENIKQLLNSLVLVIALGLTSCGYISDKPPVNLDVYQSSGLQTCKIDINKLGEIFKADQKEQIRCLQLNFIQFTKYVKTKNSSTISEGELNDFIRKFFQGKSDSIVKGLSLIFQLNMILLKDEADRISRTNISPLFSLLVIVNQEAIIITDVIKKMSDVKNQGQFWELRDQFKNSVSRFSDFTVQIIEKSPGMQQKLNIKKFLMDIGRKLGDKEINPEIIDSLIFLKQILVSGDKEVITSGELSRLVAKLPQVLTLAFDLYFAKDSNFATDAELSRFYLINTRSLYTIVDFNQKDFKLFTIDDLLRIAQDFIKDSDLKTFKPTVAALKSRLIGGDKNSFSLVDFKNILDLGQDYIERSYFNAITYNIYHGALEKNEPITYLQELDLPNQYDVFSARRITELHSDFQDIAINTRYFRTNTNGVPYYGLTYSRNKFGFLEAAQIKWLSSKLLFAYGHKNSKDVQQVSLLEFQTFLNDLKPVLIKFKLWTSSSTFAQNSVLLGDLFQDKSNGDLEINNYEATDYVLMLLSAAAMTDRFAEDMTSHCDSGINKNDPLFEVGCFNEHFFDLLKTRFKESLPRLMNYINPNNTPKKELDEYLKGVEGFARDNPNPNLPINKRDSILILGALLNIETTLIRFDKNRNNILDLNELKEAFKVYKSATISLAKLEPHEEKYALSIFLYMVSKMEIPQTGSWMKSAMFFAYHQCVSSSICRKTFMNKIEAKRLNIGKLLFYLVNQTPTTPKISKTQQPLENE